MKQISSIDRDIEDVPSFAARYEFFVKRLRNNAKSAITKNNIMTVNSEKTLPLYLLVKWT